MVCAGGVGPRFNNISTLLCAGCGFYNTVETYTVESVYKDET